MPPLRVISWNTANRKKRAQDQVGSLISRSPDLVTLQEVTHNTVDILRESLKKGGLDTRQTSAFREGIFPDAGNAIRNRDRRQAPHYPRTMDHGSGVHGYGLGLAFLF